MILQTLPALVTIEGEVLKDAVLSARDMAYMNLARSEFDKLASVLLNHIAPAISDPNNALACDIARHIEQIRIFSANFCWQHRHMGASHGLTAMQTSISSEARP